MGDIFFIQKILWHLSKKYDEVLYPIFDMYYWVSDYLILPNNVKLIHAKWDDSYTKIIWAEDCFPIKYIRVFNSPIVSETECNGFTYIPLGDPELNSLWGNLVMLDKYSNMGLDWKDWESYFQFNRKYEREGDLFYNVLKLKDDEPYILRNNVYLINNSKKNIIIESNLRIVDMDILDGFSIFDWMKVIHKAKEVHSVSTSIVFILSKLKKENVYLYPRFNLKYDSWQIEFLTNEQKNWKWRNLD